MTAATSFATGGPVWVLVGVLVGCMIWTVRFILTRLEVSIRENTHAVKNQQIALVEILHALGVEVPENDSGDPRKRAF